MRIWHNRPAVKSGFADAAWESHALFQDNGNATCSCAIPRNSACELVGKLSASC